MFNEKSATDFWDEMRKLHEEAPWAAPEQEPVDDTEVRDTEEWDSLSRQKKDDER